LLAASAVLASALFGIDLASATVSVAVGIGIALVALPPWRDARHGPASGAAVLLSGALLVLTVAWLVA